MTTGKQNHDFLLAITDGKALDEAVDFIAQTFDPQDVFPKWKLEAWALKNGFKMSTETVKEKLNK